MFLVRTQLIAVRSHRQRLAQGRSTDSEVVDRDNDSPSARSPILLCEAVPAKLLSTV